MPRYRVVTSNLTDLGAYRITLEHSTRVLTAEQRESENADLVEVLRQLYVGTLGSVRARMTAEKKAAMVAKMKATREERGVEYPSGKYHWTRRRQRGEYIPRRYRV